MIKVAAGIYIKQSGDTISATGEPAQIRGGRVPGAVHKPQPFFDGAAYFDKIMAEKAKLRAAKPAATAMPGIWGKLKGYGTAAAGAIKGLKL